MFQLSLRFVALYAVLLVPWPVLNDVAVDYLRALGAAVYGGIGDRRELDFQSLPAAQPAHELRVVIVNRSLMNQDGAGPVRNLDFDAAGLVLRPLALIGALMICTPIPWRRRVKAFLWCVLWEQIIVVGVLGFCIWNESSDISLVALSPFGKEVASSVRQMLVAQLDLAIPILLWIGVLFRRGDERLLSLSPESWVANRMKAGNYKSLSPAAGPSS
jgi:hypothetical protein